MEEWEDNDAYMEEMNDEFNELLDTSHSDEISSTEEFSEEAYNDLSNEFDHTSEDDFNSLEE